jgi:hypothetical protein
MHDQSAAPLTPDRLMQFSGGYGPSLVIETGIRLGIFDLLDNGPKNLDEVQRHTGASARGLRAALNTLVGLELLSKPPRGVEAKGFALDVLQRARAFRE